MTEYKFSISLPTDIGYSELRKRTDKYFRDGINKIQREFFESCSNKELETLFLEQNEQEACLNMIKRNLAERYTTDLSDIKKEFKTIRELVLASLSMIDNIERLVKFKNDVLQRHFNKKTIEQLSDLYENLIKEIEDEFHHFIPKSLNSAIIEKMNGKTPIEVVQKFFSSELENKELESYIEKTFNLTWIET